MSLENDLSIQGDAAHKRFFDIRKRVFPDFQSDQIQAAEAIYGLLHPYLMRGQIRTIIDLGCGTGEILSYICRKLKGEIDFRHECKSYTTPSISDYRFLGVEQSQHELDVALKNRCALQGAGDKKEGFCFDCSSILSFAKTKIADFLQAKFFVGQEGVETGVDANAVVCREDTWRNPTRAYDSMEARILDWDTCCVILTGHTLPYAEVWASISTWLGNGDQQCQPKFFFFDICSSYANALSHLAKYPTIPYCEPLHIETNNASNKEIWYSRETVTINDNTEHVTRLFVSRSPERREEHGEKQMRMSDLSFIHKLKAIGKESGKFNIRLINKISYKGGYAQHNGYFFVLRSKNSQILDTAYYNGIVALVRNAFSNNFLLNKAVSNPLYNMAQLEIVAALLPFDVYFTQLQYIGVNLCHRTTMTIDTNNFKNSKILLDPSPPPPSRKRAELCDDEELVYIPAPSLKTAVLMPHSVSNVRGLVDHESYIFSNFDQKTQRAIRIEAGVDPNLLDGTAGLLGQGKSNDDMLSTPPEYFILPIFYGTLPLFCLIFDLSFIPASYIQQETYDTYLLSIRSLIKSRFTDDVLKQFLMHFASEALGLLEINHCGETLNHEFGFRVHYLNSMFGKVLNKPWYSWADVIPTKQVRKSFVAQKENETLSKLWKEALDEAQADPLVKGSIWLMDAGFFGDINSMRGVNNDHERATRTHVDAANKMAKLAFEKDMWLEVADTCSNALEWKSKILESHYFSPQHKEEPNISVLIWLCQMVTEIVRFYSPDHTRYDENHDLKAKVVFAKLKSVFCRTYRNSGTTYRFSLYRILAFIEMFSCNRYNRYEHNWQSSCVTCPMKNGKTCGQQKLPCVSGKWNEAIACDKNYSRAVECDRTGEIYDLFKWGLSLARIEKVDVNVSIEKSSTDEAPKATVIKFSIKIDFDSKKVTNAETTVKADGDYAAHLHRWAKQNISYCADDNSKADEYARSFFTNNKSFTVAFTIESEKLTNKELTAKWVATNGEYIHVTFDNELESK